MDSDNVGVPILTGHPRWEYQYKSMYCIGVFGGGVLSIYYSTCTGSFCISLCIV